MTCGEASEQMDAPGGNADTSEVHIEVSDKRKRETEHDPAHENSLWKTSLCSFFRRSNGSCSHGESCRFAHGEHELRPKPGNVWDPTSKRAKNVGKMEADGNDKGEGECDIMMTEALEVEDENISSGLSKSLINLPMKWTSDHLKNFLSEQGVLFKSAKKKKGMIVGFVNFENMAQVNTAVKELDGKSIVNNKNLKVADIIPRGFKKNNGVALSPCTADQVEKSLRVIANSSMSEPATNDDDHSADEGNGSVPVSSILNGRSVRDVVSPLADMPYSNQLEHKKNSLIQTLKRLTRHARKACRGGVALPEWIQKAREIGGLPCKLEGIIESPLVNGYRNKCEFSVGISLKGKPTVGFLLGNFREGITAVEEPVGCLHVSKISCKYAAIFQEFLQHSLLPLWNRLNNTGFWRQLTVREGRIPCKTVDIDNPDNAISEVMLIVQVCTVGCEEGQVRDEVEKLAQAFSLGSSRESPTLPLTAFVIQDHTGISNAAPTDIPLRYIFIRKDEGDCELQMVNDVLEPRIHDHISNLRFSISPTAFFQVNTLAAEKLYSLAGDWAGLGSDTLLFDICCGTGTIGLTLAHHVGMVVGIEMNASAVSDAQRNAEINGIKNCKFVCGKAEDVIGPLMEEYTSLSQKQDEVHDFSESTDQKVHNAGDKITDEDCTLDPEDENQLLNNHNAKSNAPVQQFKNVVAIVDPPRPGLHPTVIKVLRTQSRLKKLVYISCNPESLMANAIELCTPSSIDTTEKGNKQNRRWRNMSVAGHARHRLKSMPNSEPFRPIKAMAVDLFPHTTHCELVMLLER